MKKFLLNVGAEKAGTTWLHNYFRLHPDFHDIGKELNTIQRDDLVPTFADSHRFKKDLETYFDEVAAIDGVTGDFTHYEGSTENILRILKSGFEKRGIEIVPVYIMRDPIQRAWSSWVMLGGGDYNLPDGAFRLVENYLQCKYKETIEVLNELFDPLFFFYEDFFRQPNLDFICETLGISHHAADFTPINVGRYPKDIPQSFIDTLCLNDKNINAVNFVFERFVDVPWQLSDYKKI